MLCAGLGAGLGIGRLEMSKMHRLVMERWGPWTQTFAVALLRCIQPWEENGRQLRKRIVGPAVEGPGRRSGIEIRRRLWSSM